MEIYDGSEPVLVNNVFWDNTAPQNSQVYISSGDCNVDFRYNDIEGGQAGIGPFGIGTGVYENNIDADPVFTDVLALYYQLDEGSPCIDAGIPDITGLNLPLYDLLGNVRIWNGGSGEERIDMGPYEFNAPLYTGVGQLDNWTVGQLQMKVNPNPTAGISHFEFHISQYQFVSLKIYDVHGREVAEVLDQKLSAGEHEVRWDATGLPAGMYFARLQAGNEATTMKVIKVE